MIKCMSPMFRVSFPQVFEAKAMPGSEKKKYGLTALFTMAEVNKDPEQKKLWSAMIAAAEAVVKEKWPKVTPANLQSPFRKGEEKEQFQGYGAGVVFISLTTTTKPGLVDKDVKAIINREEFYAGCFARAVINPYAWTYMGKNGVSFGLQNVQKIKDGEPFGGRTAAEDEFSSVSEDQPALETGGGIFG